METFKAATQEAAEFKTVEEELAYLRAKVAETEAKSGTSGKLMERRHAIANQIKAYRSVPAEKALHPDLRLSPGETEAITLNLSPEEHDKNIEELLGILNIKGVKNVLSVLDKLGNSHLEDDFHRFLVQYIEAGFAVRGLKEKAPLSRALRMTLYEIALPDLGKDDKQPKSLKELVSGMEQFYAGMLSVADPKHAGKDYFALEVAVSNGSQEIIFYAAVPNAKKDLFEKQAISIFPDAKIKLCPDDYNIFSDQGVAAASRAKLGKNPIFPLKLYDTFDHDPLSVLLSAFSKIGRDGEGAALQLIFNPLGDTYVKRYTKALTQIQKGTPLKKAINIPDGLMSEFLHATKELLSSNKKKEDKAPEPVDQAVTEAIRRKISSQIVGSNIRIVTSAASAARAESILSEIESAFNQFEDTSGNKLSFERMKKGKLMAFIKDFSWRVFSVKENMPLSLKELTTLLHLPSGVSASPELKQAKAGQAAAPLELGKEGTLLGVNRFRGVETNAYMTPEDRLRHFYVIGQTGTGKTTLLKNMIVQDIIAGEGVCMIDPHGSDIQDIMANIPKERAADVIYFDPSHTARPMGLNMLEFDERYPEQKTFVVNEMLSIFNKLFDMKVAGGPAFEQYFRNSTLLVMEHPESGSTLIEVARVLSDKPFRDLKMSHCKNPIIKQFWENAEQTTGDAGLTNFVPYITNKFDNFLTNEIMRPIVAQQTSAFNFREMMDTKKIFLVNLSKGRLGDLNAHLIGLILVGKILMAALSRVDSFGKNLPPFYLYIDEFQNVTTDSISTILSEARKYKLSLNIAHQYIAQLEDHIKNAVFGNVGSISTFRVGAEDAEYLQKQFEPVFTASDIMNLDNHNAYLKLLVGGRPVKPFNIETLAPPKGSPEIIEQLKELSYFKYGKDRTLVEAEIKKKYGK
jgi:hypothetical protein